MTWRVGIEQNWALDSVALHIVERVGPDRARLIRPAELVYETVDGPDAFLVRHPPALVIDDELGRALLDALAAHYGGAVDVRTSREDLLAERRRAEKLTDALITIATRP